MDDGAGTVQALTTFSAIRPERLSELRRRLALIRYTPGLGRPLLDLGFIHYARWGIVDALPVPGGGWRGLRSKYLLFQGIYDGAERDYLDVFSEVIPSRIAAVWSACAGFEEHVERVPAARGRVIAPAAFREFVERNKLDGIAMYTAYGATANAVRQAILMDDRLQEIHTFPTRDEAYHRRLRTIGSMAIDPLPDRGSLRDRIDAVYEPWKRAVRGRYGVNPLTLAIPLKEGTALEQGLQRDPAMRWLRHTDAHYARVCRLPEVLGNAAKRTDRTNTPWLLFTSDYFGARQVYAERLRRRVRAAEELLTQSIDGFPGTANPARFYSWIDDHALPTDYYVAGYPPRSVAAIEDLIKRRSELADKYASRRYLSGPEIVTELEGSA